MAADCSIRESSRAGWLQARYGLWAGPGTVSRPARGPRAVFAVYRRTTAYTRRRSDVGTTLYNDVASQAHFRPSPTTSRVWRVGVSVRIGNQSICVSPNVFLSRIRYKSSGGFNGGSLNAPWVRRWAYLKLRQEWTAG